MKIDIGALFKNNTLDLEEKKFFKCQVNNFFIKV